MVIALSAKNLDYRQIVACLQGGGVIVYPTDTAYALGCDATNKEAAEKIFTIKGRDKAKTLSLIVASRFMAEEWLEFSPRARELADKFWPGPLGLVLRVKKPGLAPATMEDGCAGVRVPDNEVARQLSQRIDTPLVATSANASGQGPCYTIEEARKSLGDSLELIDYIIDAGELPARGVSTMVKVAGDSIEILRNGIIKLF